MFGLIVLAAYPWPLAGHVALGVVVGLINFVTVWEGTATLTGVANLGGFSPTALALAESGLIILLVAWVSRTDFFYMEKRLNLGQNCSRGYTTSFLTGIVFAAGWTPCVGPILASILAMAATGQSAAQGAVVVIVLLARPCDSISVGRATIQPAGPVIAQDLPVLAADQRGLRSSAAVVVAVILHRWLPPDGAQSCPRSSWNRGCCASWERNRN